MNYIPAASRYESMVYNRCGLSGLKLPAISLGLWHNWGEADLFENGRKIIQRAFDLGITHFDLANNYGPPPGSAEINFGHILKEDFQSHRDEMIISTKAGWDMWPGPYGNFGTRKYLIASIDQSLKRMGLEYVDIFYHHRPDPDTPMEESMGALDHIVRSGKALYAGISQYNPDQTQRAIKILHELGTPCLIHQPRYSMFDRWIEDELLNVIKDAGIGCIAFSPLAQGLLTDRYITGIPSDSRAANKFSFLKKEHVTEEKVAKTIKLNTLAEKRGQTLAQMAISWVLRDPFVTSALVGVSKVSQLEDLVDSIKSRDFSEDELKRIDKIISK